MWGGGLTQRYANIGKPCTAQQLTLRRSISRSKIIVHRIGEGKTLYTRFRRNFWAAAAVIIDREPLPPPPPPAQFENFLGHRRGCAPQGPPPTMMLFRGPSFSGAVPCISKVGSLLPPSAKTISTLGSSFEAGLVLDGSGWLSGLEEGGQVSCKK